MNQLTFWSEEHPAKPSQSQGCEQESQILEGISLSPMLDFLTTLDPSGSFGKMCQVSLVPIKEQTFQPSSLRWSNAGMGSPTECLMLSMLEGQEQCLNGEGESLLSDVLEVGNIPPRFYLSERACLGILRRAEKRGKSLPRSLQVALEQVVSDSIAKTNGSSPPQSEHLTPNVEDNAERTNLS